MVDLAPGTDRHLALTGAANFRDIGGYPTATGGRLRWSRVYRSDALSALTDADQQKVAALGLYALCDYRIDRERERNPDRLPQGHGIKLHWPGFFPEGGESFLADVGAGKLDTAGIRDELNQHYQMFATTNLGNFASTFDLILEAQGRPVLIHCTSGKDRTGWAAALIMLAAGCSDETVEEDYFLTDRYRRPLQFMFDRAVSDDLLEALMAPDRRYLRTALAALRAAHGPGNRWLHALGFDAQAQQELRHLLVAE